MSRTGTSGFTTIELLVVLVIIVTMSSLVIVSMGPALTDARLRSGSRMVVSALNYGRSFAVTHRTQTAVVFYINDNAVEVRAKVRDANGEEKMEPITTHSGRYRKLPQGLRIAHVDITAADEGENIVGFSELGQSNGAMITLEDRRGKKRVISLDPITGHCAVKTGQEQ